MESILSSCYYCSLPIVGRPIRTQVGGQPQTFCCHGCVIVYYVMGRRGEPGQASMVLARLVAGGVFAMAVMAISWSTYLDSLLGGAGGTNGTGATDVFLFKVYLPLVATIATIVLGYPIVVGAAQGVRCRRLGLDSLIAIGVGGAYALSLISTVTGQGHLFFDTAVTILFLVTLGRYLESQAKARAAEGVRTIFALTPPLATLLRDGVEERVEVGRLAPGDTVRVVAGEAFPADGRVIDGEAGVNEGALTGEETPVLKRVGDTVLAGTINTDGVFTVAVQRVRDQTVVSQVARLMEEARQANGPVARLSDRVAAVLTPLALVLSCGAFVYWTQVGGVERGLMVALSVLLITCPCAVGIATPLAIWVGLAEGARRGVLIRSSEVMERLGRVRQVFFDKTGTLTTGSLSLAGVVAGDGWRGCEAALLTDAASLARLSAHPTAQPLMERAAKERLPTKAAREVRYRPGLGIEGVIDGERVVIGSRRLIEREGIIVDDELLREEARRSALAQSVAYIGSSGRVSGLLCFASSLRSEAREAASNLQAAGVSVAVLTGDGEAQAHWVSEQLGIDDVHWGLLPQDKVGIISRAREEGAYVMMVGDGINDAPALAAADVGVALGCGSDLARQAADISLIGSNLVNVSWTLRLAKRVRRAMFANLAWGLLYNSLGLGLAAMGLLAPWMSALIMVVSSLVIVGNSLRLKSGEMER